MNPYLKYVLSVDTAFFQYINGYRWPILDQIMPMLTLLGDGTLLCFMAALYFSGGRRERSVAFSLLAGYCWAGILVQIVKYAVKRSRPPAVLADIHILGPTLWTKSFPSGHTASAFMMAAVLAAAYPRFRYAYYTIAALVGYSRIYLGVHFPLDVIFGALIGIAAGKYVYNKLACRGCNSAKPPG